MFEDDLASVVLLGVCRRDSPQLMEEENSAYGLILIASFVLLQAQIAADISRSVDGVSNLVAKTWS